MIINMCNTFNKDNMKKIKNISIGLVLTFCFTVLATSCKENADLELPRLFRPINFNVETNKTVATITWAKVENAVSYTLQLSTDSLNYEANMVLDTTLTDLSFVKELAGETNYYARLYANAADSTMNSKYNSLSFKTPAENIFTGYGTDINTGKLYSAYMTDVHTMTIKWVPAANVTHLILTSADGQTRDSLVISGAEALAGEKVVGSLANSKWSVKIYNNKILRGTTSGIVEGDVILSATDDLPTAITNATDGQVLLLAKGALYQMGSATYRLGKNIKVRGLSADNRPVLAMTSGTPTSTSSMLGFVDGSLIDYVKFENIDFTGYCDNSNSATKIGYLFNNNVLTTVKNLSFTNCNLHNFGNTPMRVQSAKNQVIDTLSFNGCTIFDVGFSSTYAVVNSNSADFINNINFSYCTIYNFKGSLVLRQNQSFNAINITNCTINQGMQDTGSTRFLIDANTATVNGTGVTIKNCILGQTGSVEKGAAGIRTTGTVSISTTYCTSDYYDETLVGGAAFSVKDKMTLFSGKSTDLWNSPASGDFSLKATSFAGKGTIGDLRWY